MRFIPALAVLAALSSGALAQTAASDQDHAAHHPPGASAPVSATKAPAKPAAKASAPSTARVNSAMKSMQEMHDKMMAAKTPEERQALMAEHMKSMQDGMAMMARLKAPDAKGGGKPQSPAMMSQRMDMMEMMMQMMMDREAARTPAGK